MQPFGLHGPCVHIAFIGGIVEDPEFRLWGQLQTDVTHQDADNGKGTCGAPPRQQKSEVWTAPMETRRGPERSPTPAGMVLHASRVLSGITVTIRI